MVSDGNKTQRTLHRKITTAMINLGRKFWTLILILQICILLSIFTFGSSRSLIISSTAVLKIDTKKATVNDLLGGIKILPDRYRPSATASSTTTRFGRTATSSTTSSTPTSTYLIAESSLKNLTEILEGIDSYVTDQDFSLATVFGIHEHIYLANTGFRCWSGHFTRLRLPTVSDSNNNCPNYGFMSCFGEIGSDAVDYSVAYSRRLRISYLKDSTSLSSDQLDEISRLWEYIYKAANWTTLILNFDYRAYDSITKLSCSIDYMYANSHIRMSKPVILGILGLIFAIFIMIAQISSIIASLICWLISFAMVVAMFAVSFSSNIPAAKYINKSEGIRAESAKGGLVAYFVVLVILFLSVLILLLIELKTKRGLPTYNDEQKGLKNDLDTSVSNDNQTNLEETKPDSK